MSVALNPLEQDYLDQNAAAWPMVTGPTFLGIGIDMFCLGVIICQFIYWNTRLAKDERWPLKCLVYWLAFGSVAHTAFCQAFGFSVFVIGYGEPLTVFRGWWVKGDCVFELLLAMPIEVFYAFRAYELWGRPKSIKYGLPVIFAGSIALGIANTKIGYTDPVNSTTSPFFIAWVATLFIIDWLLSVLIVVALVRKRNGISHSDRLITRVVKWSAEAQLLPSLVTAGLIIKALVAPHSLIVLVFIFVPKVWVICGLAVINFRKVLRRDMEEERQRRQNTLNFLSTELDIQEAPAGRHSGSGMSSRGNVPTLSLTGAAPTTLSPLSEKGGEIDSPDGVYPYSNSTGTYFSAVSTSSDGAAPIPTTKSIHNRTADPGGTRPSSGSANEAGLSFAILPPRGERRGSLGPAAGGLSFGTGLGRLRSRGIWNGPPSLGGLEDDDRDLGDMSFEEMLGMKS